MEIKKNMLIMAPLAGVTDYAFRKICKEMGADLTVTEMVSAKALSFKDQKTAVMAELHSDEAPVAVQIFGAEADTMAMAAKSISTGTYAHCKSEILPSVIDVNMGCPVHKIVANGEGSALMNNLPLAYDILKNVVESSSVPVTVKMRAGFSKDHKNAVELALLAEKAGVSAITIHGRTKEEMYGPFVDYDIIKEVKEAVSIPVIGNGGIFSAADAQRMLETGVDGLMIARGALGNPFIFREIRCALESKPYKKPEIEERLQTALRHLELLLQYKGQTGLLEARKHIAWYIKGIPGAPALRNQVNQISDADEMREAILKLIK